MEENKKQKTIYEFGGPIGCIILIFWSHYILYYFYFCISTNNGQIIIPTSFSELKYQYYLFIALFRAKAIPSCYVISSYLIFIISQLVFAQFVPGITIEGRAIDNKGKRLKYFCNGYISYYLSLTILFVLNYYGIFQISHIVDNFGQYLTIAVILADAQSIIWYLYGIFYEKQKYEVELSGNHIYDFFMGSTLYPRIFKIDIKMIAEVRWSWLTLFLITLSAAFKQYELTKTISPQMFFLIYAHFLYSNATVKGEHYIPTTWDMFREKFGWMLCFWNVAGVPYLYCFQSLYILQNQSSIHHSTYALIFIYLLLTSAYYVFDTANLQKASYKATNIKRRTFPVFNYGFLKDPKVLKTPNGNLLIDGYYKHCRKIQYTADIVMALSWGLITGGGSILNYFYVVFFTCMIIHRQTRDEERCSQKYGKYWDEYKKIVPYIFIPNLI